MKVAIGADHAGFELKERIRKQLVELGHVAIDLGTNSTDPMDYPDFAQAVGLRNGTADRGLLVCGSGVRAGLCHDHYSAHQGVEHDDMNVLVLGGRGICESPVLELVEAFLGARYTRHERHQRRLEKVKRMEQRFME